MAEEAGLSDGETSIGDISNTDDDSSLDSVRGSFEFLEQKKFFRKLTALRCNSPTEHILDLSYLVSEARDWDADEIEGPVTIGELRKMYEEISVGCPTTHDRLLDTFRCGCKLLTELTLKESIMADFTAELKAAIFKTISGQPFLRSLKFFGANAKDRTIADSLFLALSMNNSLELLEIRRVAIDETALDAILTKKHSKLIHLEIIECSLEAVSEESLSKGIERNTGLETLNWQGNSPNMTEALLKGLEKHQTLKDLSLFDEGMGGESIGTSLAKCSTLESFFLFHRHSFNLSGKNHFDLDAFFQGIASAPGMRKISLRVQGTTLSWQSPGFGQPLETLDLAMCEWSPASRESMFAAFPASQTIDLSSNIFRQSTISTTETLPSCAWSRLFGIQARSLQRLDLRNCGLRSYDILEIASLVKRRIVKVKELDLSFNRFDVKDLGILVDAFTNADFLEVLGLCGPVDPASEEDSSPHGFSLISRLLQNTCRLQSIDLTDTTLFVGSYTDVEEEEFVIAMSDHEALESIHIDGVWLSPRQCRTFFLALCNSRIKIFSARYLNFSLYMQDLDVDFANVLSKNKSLKHVDLEQSTQSPSSTTSLLSGIQKHTNLKSVHLGTIDCYDGFLDQLCEMLRHNQSLTSLSMRLRKWSLPEMELFYREFFACLCEFQSLRELDINDGVTGHPILKPTGEVLLQSLQENVVLESISVSMAFLPYDLQEMILFHLRLNRLGRRLLNRENDHATATSSIWPLILGKMVSPRDVRDLHYFIYYLMTTSLLK